VGKVGHGAEPNGIGQTRGRPVSDLRQSCGRSVSDVVQA
jgi:hypothetical protein